MKERELSEFGFWRRLWIRLSCDSSYQPTRDKIYWFKGGVRYVERRN